MLGLILQSASGNLRTNLRDKGSDIPLNWIPLDICVKMIIAATWKRASMKSTDNEVPVYNCSFDEKMTITLEQIYQMGTSSVYEEVPLGLDAKTTSMLSTRCSVFHKVTTFFLQLLPAILHDCFKKIFGNLPKSMKQQRELHESVKSYRRFFHRKLIIKNEKAYELTRQLRHEDVVAFDYENAHFIDFLRTMRCAMFGLRRFIFNLDDENVEEDRKKVEEKKENELWIEVIVGSLMALMLYAVFSSYIECRGGIRA